ncbi:cobalamin B12-binding domain-containing protein [Flavimaricola marinus]|uniref:cobalamin B12-binding domain-containing protein n=1 Tax=Flavimaricola marinus TaxID=1819565 RepID=UPI0014550777|nr:cobalamin B12-binding domain-containing protein [Flavimaricola marinus]
MDQSSEERPYQEAALKAYCAAHDLEPEWLAKLIVACLAVPGSTHVAVAKQMQQSGIDAVSIAERYVPAAARLLGEQWCSDQSDFARVTVGCSRLHRVLRDVATAWRGPELTDPSAQSLLIVVESGTYHTLGATVLSGALRRSGFAVRLLVGAEQADLEAHLQNSDYAAVFISASGVESLETVRRFVDLIRNVASLKLPVVIGGPITRADETTAHEILVLTGADYCTDDPNEALDLCGLAQHKRAEPMTGSTQRA